MNILEVFQRLVEIPSVGTEHGEVAVVKFAHDFLAAIPGVRIEVLEGASRRPNLLCTLGGLKDGPALLVAAHTDVASVAGQSWKTDPFQPVTRDGRWFGRGASDAKGGVAAALLAVRDLANQWSDRPGSVTLALTADEDSEGRWGLPWLARSGVLSADAAIVMSPAGEHEDYDGIPLAARGFANARVEVECGDGGYTWSYRPDAPHAVAVACELVRHLENSFRPSPAVNAMFPGGPTVTAGSWFQGGAEGLIPTRASFSVECRTLPGASADAFFGELSTFVRDHARGASTRVVRADWMWFGGWEQGCELDATHPLAIATRDAFQRVMRRPPQFTGFPMFSEAACIAALGIPTLPALGPGTWRAAHGVDESVGEQALKDATAILRELLDRCLASDMPLPRTAR